MVEIPTTPCPWKETGSSRHCIKERGPAKLHDLMVSDVEEMLEHPLAAQLEEIKMVMEDDTSVQASRLCCINLQVSSLWYPF